MRKRRERQERRLPQPTKKGKLTVTKIDAATRQLETAITMWFADGDPVAICTLTHAAHEIFLVLNKSFGGPPTLFNGPHVKEEYKDELLGWVRDSARFFKHAAKDPYETHYFPARATVMVMVDSIEMYKNWGIGRRPVFDVLMRWLWFSDPMPFKIKPEQFGIERTMIDEVTRGGKRKFFNLMLPIVTRQIAGAE